MSRAASASFVCWVFLSHCVSLGDLLCCTALCLCLSPSTLSTALLLLLFLLPSCHSTPVALSATLVSLYPCNYLLPPCPTDRELLSEEPVRSENEVIDSATSASCASMSRGYDDMSIAVARPDRTCTRVISKAKSDAERESRMSMRNLCLEFLCLEFL